MGAKLTKVQKQLKSAALSIEKAEAHLQTAINIVIIETDDVRTSYFLIKDYSIKLEKLTELRKSIWS